MDRLEISVKEGNTMFADYHVHTEFSDDSVYPMESVVQDAIRMKIDELCFTDHVDYGTAASRLYIGGRIRWRMSTRRATSAKLIG